MGTKVCEWPKYGSTGVLQIDRMSQTYFSYAVNESTGVADVHSFECDLCHVWDLYKQAAQNMKK